MNPVIETLNQWSDGYLRWVTAAAWQAALLGCVVLIVLRLGRRWPAPLRYALLLTALVKFVIPPLASAPTGMFSQFDTSVTHPLTVEITDIEEDAVAVAPSVASTSLRDAPTIAATPVQPQLQFGAWLMLLHIVGVVVFVGCVALNLVQLVRLVRTSGDVDDPLVLNDFRKLCATLGLKRPLRFLTSESVNAPLAFGIVRPTVLLPRELLGLDRADLQTVLTHELAHVRRGDLIVNWLQLAILAVWWFHPIAWLLHRAIRSTREECCDDLLVVAGWTNGAAYCETLLRVAAAPRLTSNSLASGIADAHPLGRRIRRLMDPRVRRSRRLGLVGLATVLLTSLVVLPGLSGSSPKTAAHETNQDERAISPSTLQPDDAVVDDQNNSDGAKPLADPGSPDANQLSSSVEERTTDSGRLQPRRVAANGKAVDEDNTPRTDADTKADDEKRAESLAEMTDLIDRTTLEILDDDGEVRKAKRIENPVFRYTDETARILDSTLWVWKDGGRPVAIQKIENNAYGRPVGWTYCFASLSAQGRVRVRWPNAPAYESREPGVKFKPVPGAPAPSEIRIERDGQLRAIARRFSCDAYAGSKRRKYRHLRLLPRPILQYSDENHGIVAGAIFAFATGTNPDALLLIEARVNAQEPPQWQYASVQMTNSGVELKYKDVEVWTATPEPRPRHFATWTYMWLRK